VEAGRKGVDEGRPALAKGDRLRAIRVGQGLEGAIPDATAKPHRRGTITPHFKSGDFDGGIEAGVNQMMPWSTASRCRGPTENGNTMAAWATCCPAAGGGVVVAGARALFGRLFGSLATGGIAGGLAWLLSHLLPIGVGAGVVPSCCHAGRRDSRGWSAGRGWGGGFGGGLGGGFGRRGGGAWWWFQRRWRRLQRRRRLGELVMQIGRLIRHTTATHWRTRLLFPGKTWMPSNRPSAALNSRMPGKSASPSKPR